MFLNTATTLNPRPKKRFKIKLMPDLTWNDLPIEIKEYIVLGAPKELRSLFRLVCWEWYTLVNPHVIKSPSEQKWGSYHAKHYQTAPARWALRTGNVNLLEWLVLKQGMLPPKVFKIHSTWLEFAAREPRYALVHHLMDSWTRRLEPLCTYNSQPSARISIPGYDEDYDIPHPPSDWVWRPYCHEVAMIAMRSGNMRLLKLSLGKEMTLSEFSQHIRNKKMSHAPFADMDNNDEMIAFCHPIDCNVIHECLRYQIEEIIKVKHFEPFAYVEPILSLEKYRFVKNKYRMAFNLYAEYGSIKGMISILNKYGRRDELRHIKMGAPWVSAVVGGHLDVLKYMLNAYKERKPTYLGNNVNKHIRRHDYKVLDWLFDEDLVRPDEIHLRYTLNRLPDDPELIPILSWLMKKCVLYKPALKFSETDRLEITVAGIKTNRLEVIHWIYKEGLLWTEELGRPIPSDIHRAIKHSMVNGCYHLLRVLHNLNVLNLNYTLVCSETMTLMYYEDARAMAKRPTQWIHHPSLNHYTAARGLLEEYDTFNFISSKLGKLNPPPSF